VRGSGAGEASKPYRSDTAQPAAGRPRRPPPLLTVNHEAAVKDGFAALETYLKDRFIAARPRATFLADRPGRQDLGWACCRGCLCSHA